MHASTDMQEYAGTHRDRYKHFGIALAEAFVFLFLLYFALYFDLYFDLFFLFMLRVSNRIQEFQVEILFEHFFDGNVDLRRDCDCDDDGGVSVGVVVSGKAEKTFALL